MIADLHIHTHISGDSQALMEEYCQKAIANGVDFICFTDHVDNNPQDDGYGLYRVEQYFNEFEKVKKEYKDQIVLLSGMEFSEPHLYPSKLREVSKYPYDMIIGSIHWVNNMYPGRAVSEKYSAKEYFDMYWELVLETVSYGHFDCLGHMDFPKRYYGELVFDMAKMERIFKEMVQHNIIPEINTSSLRKGLTTALPDLELLTLYKQCGGSKVTIGSDAHSPEDLAAGNDYAKNLISNVSLEEVIFRKRQPVII